MMANRPWWAEEAETMTDGDMTRSENLVTIKLDAGLDVNGNGRRAWILIRDGVAVELRRDRTGNRPEGWPSESLYLEVPYRELQRYVRRAKSGKVQLRLGADA